MAVPQRNLVPRAGATALSLAVHCTVLVLAALAFGMHPALRPPLRMIPLITLEQAPPTPAKAAPAPAAAPRLPHRPRAAARPDPAAAQAPAPHGSEPQPLVSSLPAAAEPAAEAQPAPAPADSAAPVGHTEAPPLLYLAEVSRLIRLRLDYPARARLERAQGTAVVRILLARDGTVLSVEVIQGAGNPALDEEARAVVLRIHKFPGLPDDYARGEERFAIDQPIGFRGA